MKPNDERETPLDLFERLDRRFRFTLDACASEALFQVPKYYSIADDGLAKSWAGERVWVNPPFSNIRPWVAKAATSGAELVCMLVPANRTEQPWWQAFVEPLRDRPGSGLTVEFLAGRTRFLKDGVPMGSPQFACCLLIWRQPILPKPAGGADAAAAADGAPPPPPPPPPPG